MIQNAFTRIITIGQVKLRIYIEMKLNDGKINIAKSKKKSSFTVTNYRYILDIGVYILYFLNDTYYPLWIQDPYISIFTINTNRKLNYNIVRSYSVI